MKNAVKVFTIGLMTILLSCNASLLFSQSKGKTIKKGSVYVCNIKDPRQVAVSGTPAWMLSTMFYIFEGEGRGAMGVQICAYTINLSTGGLGDAITAKASESHPFAYQERNGLVYIWDPDEDAPKDESEYIIILTIDNDEYLTPIKTSEKDLSNSSKFVYMGDYKKITTVGDLERDRLERIGLTKLLLLRNHETYIELLEKTENSNSSNNDTEQVEKTENPSSSNSNTEMEEKTDNSSSSNKNTENVFEYDELDVKPSFPGGESAMMTYIAKNVKYPQIARERGIQGRVYVRFIIEADGSISNAEVMKEIGGGCDEEAVRVVNSMPKWQPGKKQGKTVRVNYVVPVNFHLANY